MTPANKTRKLTPKQQRALEIWEAIEGAPLLELDDTIEFYGIPQTVAELYLLLKRENKWVDRKRIGIPNDSELAYTLIFERGFEPHELYEDGWPPSVLAKAMGMGQVEFLDTHVRHKVDKLRPKRTGWKPPRHIEEIINNKNTPSWSEIWRDFYGTTERGKPRISLELFCQALSSQGHTSDHVKERQEFTKAQLLKAWKQADGSKRGMARLLDTSARTLQRRIDELEAQENTTWDQITTAGR